MPRIAEGREPARPSSPRQQERYRRMLRAAATHGAEHGLDGVQMHEVAQDAGVAIATLYRYFPSKTQLFTAVMHERVTRLATLATWGTTGHDVPDAIASVLNRAADELLAHPLLAQAMLQSNNAVVAGPDPAAAVTETFSGLILRVVGVEDPDDLDVRLVRLVQQTWYGLLVSVLNGHVSHAQAREDTLLACQRLCAGLGEQPGPGERGGTATAS